MKLRAQLYLIASLMLLTLVCVIVVEAGLWTTHQRQVEKRNYVTLCLKDVFELNLLTHELNLFRDMKRPVEQMELKLETLTGRFQDLSAQHVFSESEILAIKNTLQSIQSLLERFQTAPKQTASGRLVVNPNEFYDHLGSQLLQRAQTLYGAFTLMRERLVKEDEREEQVNMLVRISLLALLGGAVALTLFFLYRHVVQSFALLEAGAAEVAAGNREFRFPIKTTRSLDEIGAVKSAFNGMVVSLNEAVVEINKKNRELETLLYVVSHDLKEPLRSVEYFSKIVYERYAPALEPEAQDYLSRSVQGAARLRHLLDDILILSKARKVTGGDAAVPTKEIIGRALERLDRKIKETGAQIDVADDFQSLKAEPLWAVEAVYNLVDNALKYTLPGQKPRIEILAFRSEKNPPAEAGLVIQDRGPGVPSEMTERIFSLFQRGVGRSIEGTGAGLAIVRAVAERHGGRAWVEPREGGGSKFMITFKI